MIDPQLLTLLMQVGGPMLLQAGSKLINDNGYDPKLMQSQLSVEKDPKDIENVTNGWAYEDDLNGNDNPMYKFDSSPKDNMTPTDLANEKLLFDEYYGNKDSDADFSQLMYGTPKSAYESAINMAGKGGPAITDDEYKKALNRYLLNQDLYKYGNEF